MSETGSNKGSSGVGRQDTTRGSIWLAVTWVRLIVGLALVAEGGVLYAHARMSDGGPSWLVGAVAIVVGAVLALPGVTALYARSHTPEVIISEPIPGSRDDSIPMLGALLVFKYKLITEDQLKHALEVQRKDGPNRRLLGGILLDMGLISSAELQTALAYQRSVTGNMPLPGVDADQSSDEADTVATPGASR